MTADWVPLPYEVLKTISNRIVLKLPLSLLRELPRARQLEVADAPLIAHFAMSGIPRSHFHACTTCSPNTFSNRSKSRSRCSSWLLDVRQNVAIQQSMVLRTV
jgi:hypothetical protein